MICSRTGLSKALLPAMNHFMGEGTHKLNKTGTSNIQGVDGYFMAFIAIGSSPSVGRKIAHNFMLALGRGAMRKPQIFLN
jgi:hypothetical protein